MPAAWTIKVPAFLVARAELFLVIGILVVVSAVFHWIPYRQAFLNFFYLPVLAAGYLLGARKGTLTSVMCVLLVLVYYGWDWARDALAAGHVLDAPFWIASRHSEILFSLAMWGGFLILTGYAFARAHESMVGSYSRVRDLNQELRGQAEELKSLNEALQASATELQQRAEQLQEKNLLIENLKQQAEQTLYSAMDSTVARLMIQGRLRQEKRNLSVLFCDLKNFSAYSEQRHPEVVLEELNNFYGAMEELIEAYHGHIDKYMGDGIMCEFGAPVDYEQHCLQAVAASLKMQERFQELKLPWSLRVGVASGDAVVGLLGSRRRNYSALGDVVNLAHRLEELCEPGQVYIAETTYERVQSFVEVEQIRSLAGRRNEDQQYREAISAKEEELAKDPANPELLFTIGMFYFHTRDASKALSFFRRALELKPDDNEIKVAYADASVKREEYEKISIRGLAQKQAVFRVLRLASPLRNLERFPRSLLDRYEYVEKLIEIPDQVTLPTEVVDGTVGHSLGVAFLSYALADHLGLPEELKRDLLVGARLQDLGKSQIWHHTLNRRGGLSDHERKELEGHAAASVSIAKRIGYDRPGVLEIIAHHHESMDGTGFARGLKGEEIPLGARISGVADVYCALTAWRTYRPAWDCRVALSELRKGVANGKHDPKVVDALGELMDL